MARHAWWLAALGLMACTSRNLGFQDQDLGANGDGGGNVDLRGVDFGTSCNGLNEQLCAAAAGCVADYCFNCSCTPTFNGCRAPNVTPLPCPALGCPQPLCCHDQKDCSQNGLFCVAPDQDIPQCGVCQQPLNPCTEDKHCANSGIPNAICGNSPCVCGQTCVAGCALTADCREGEICQPNHHCRARTCAEGCTQNFICSGGTTCVRKTCKVDNDCPRKMCVLGFCHNGLGNCQGPPPP